MNGARSTTTGTADTTLNATLKAVVSPPDPLLIDAKAASSLLHIKSRRLWTLTNCKAIPSFKVGRSVLYSPDELKAWIACGCPTEGGAAVRVRKAVRA